MRYVRKRDFSNIAQQKFIMALHELPCVTANNIHRSTIDEFFVSRPKSSAKRASRERQAVEESCEAWAATKKATHVDDRLPCSCTENFHEAQTA